ncbi:MAG: acyl-CoA synthetase [Thermoproteota archaeon]
MGEIPEEYLPPKEWLPEKIYALPEFYTYPRKLNLAKLFLDNNAEKRGDKTAIYYEDQRITYRELQEKVNKVGNALKSLGIEDNDRVMLRSPNIPEWIISFFACWKIGAVPTLLSPLARAKTIAYQANDSEAKAIIVSSDVLEDVKKAKKDFNTIEHVIVVGKDEEGVYPSLEDLIQGQPSDLEALDVSLDHVGRLIYTSGTTGIPKGAIATFRDILTVTDCHAKHILRLSEKDVVGGHPSFTFAFGSVNFTLEPWRFGASLSIMERFTPEKMFETIEKHRISVLCCVPTAFRMMLELKEAEKKYDLSSLRLCQSAGEWCPKSTIVEWERRFGVRIIDSLGSSELMYWCSAWEEMPESKLGSTGLPVPGYELKIVDENFREVHPGEIGELVLRGPVGFTYWRKPDEQKGAIKDGWSRCGLLYMRDEDGYFWYKGRIDDMIVSAGYKIPGGEVEALLNEHEAIVESAVVASPDSLRGHVAKAFVVLKEGYEPSDRLAKELQDYVKTRTDPWKYPRRIEFVKSEDLPRTVTGKIQRRLLAKMEQERFKENA